MHRCATSSRPLPFIVHRQRSPASTGSFSSTKGLSLPQRTRSCSRRHSLWFRHVLPSPMANQRARVQCASRSLNKVFVGRRSAPLPAPGKYRCPSTTRFGCSSATLTVMSSPHHLHCSQACSAKYSTGSSAAALSNPSGKLIVNGVPHWPSSAGPLAHFALAVQHVTPSSPAYLER